MEDLITQRVYALALGDEDLNDHDRLRHDPLLVVLVGTPDPTGQERPRARDRGKAFAGKRTCNRLDQRLVELFLEAHATPPQEIVRARDATDDPLHGHQEARFFHGYYGHYCSVPLSIFASAFLRCARRRPANRDARAGAVEETARLVGAIRARWPTVQIMRRVASGFCRESLMAWCAAHQVDSGFGVAKNCRLLAQGQAALAQAQAQYAQTGPPARVCTACLSRPLDTWSQEHRGVAKAEYLAKGATPRLVGTSLAPAQWTAQALYEERYYARGDMANRIKAPQRDLFADRPSTAKRWSHQIRLSWSAFAYLLLQTLRRLGRHGTEMAHAQCGTIRLRLLQMGALRTVSIRRSGVALASGYPYVTLLQHVYAQ